MSTRKTIHDPERVRVERGGNKERGEYIRIGWRGKSRPAHGPATIWLRLSLEQAKDLRDWLGLLLPLLFLALTGCAAETGPVFEYSAPDDAPLTPDVACVADRPVCVEAIWCGGPDAEDWPLCYGNDGMCMVRPVPAGEECLGAGYVGRCDGKGACK